MATGEEILGPNEENYHERGIRVNYFAEERGSERAIKMLVKKMKGEPFETDLPMPKFDRVPPAPAIKDIKHAKIAVVTSGGVVPVGETRIISNLPTQRSSESTPSKEKIL